MVKISFYDKYWRFGYALLLLAVFCLGSIVRVCIFAFRSVLENVSKSFKVPRCDLVDSMLGVGVNVRPLLSSSSSV